MLDLDSYVPEWMVLDYILYTVLWFVVGCIILPYLSIGGFICGFVTIGIACALLNIYAIVKMVLCIKFLLYARKKNKEFLGDLQEEIKRIKKETISLSTEKLKEWKETMHIE